MNDEDDLLFDLKQSDSETETKLHETAAAEIS